VNFQTSLIDGELLKLSELIRCAIVLPTASTAPFGDLKLTLLLGEAITLNNLMPVPVQIPLMPLFVETSDAYTSPHSKLTYHPSESDVQIKACATVPNMLVYCRRIRELRAKLTGWRSYFLGLPTGVFGGGGGHGGGVLGPDMLDGVKD